MKFHILKFSPSIVKYFSEDVIKKKMTKTTKSSVFIEIFVVSSKNAGLLWSLKAKNKLQFLYTSIVFDVFFKFINIFEMTSSLS